VVLSPRHIEVVQSSSVTKAELDAFGEEAIKYVHFEDGKLYLDFDLNMKEVVLFTKGKRTGKGEAERGAKDGRLERSDSSIPPTTITNNHFHARFAFAPYPNPFRDSLRSSQLKRQRITYS